MTASSSSVGDKELDALLGEAIEQLEWVKKVNDSRNQDMHDFIEHTQVSIKIIVGHEIAIIRTLQDLNNRGRLIK